MSVITNKDLRVIILYKKYLELVDILKSTSMYLQFVMSEYVRIGEDPSEFLETISEETQRLVDFCNQTKSKLESS